MSEEKKVERKPLVESIDFSLVVPKKDQLKKEEKKQTGEDKEKEKEKQIMEE